MSDFPRVIKPSRKTIFWESLPSQSNLSHLSHKTKHFFNTQGTKKLSPGKHFACQRTITGQTPKAETQNNRLPNTPLSSTDLSSSSYKLLKTFIFTRAWALSSYLQVASYKFHR